MMIQNLKKSINYCVDINTDYPGNDFDLIIEIQHWTECAQFCAITENCKFWTLTGDGNCFLKSAYENKVVAYGLISGSKDCINEC